MLGEKIDTIFLSRHKKKSMLQNSLDVSVSYVFGLLESQNKKNIKL